MKNNKKCLSVLSTAAMGTLIATALTSGVSAKTTDVIVKLASQNVKFNFSELNNSYEDKSLGLEAPLYDKFSTNEGIISLLDDKTGYVDYKAVSKAAEDAAVLGKDFALDTFTEAAKGDQILPEVKIDAEWKDGQVTPVDGQLKVESVSAINETTELTVTFSSQSTVTEDKVTGKTLTLKQGETTVTATYKEGSLDNNAAVFVISETNLPEGIYEVTSTNFEIPANITTLYNISAPEVKSVNVKTGAKDLVLTLSEKVKATAEGSISVEVRKDDTLIDVGTPVLSEDGLTITIPSKDGSIFADAKYDVKLSGISDMAGLSIADKNTASVTKKTAADKIEITSIGVAPAANQTIAYKLTDNYGIEYTDATALASGKITSAAATLTVSGLPIEVAITGDKTATFNATGLAKDTEIEVSITYTAGDVTKTATTKLKVGDAAAAASIKNITISNAQGETDPETTDLYWKTNSI
ncbi:hypothetical protein [Clostridium tetanomorphum]|uniref:hypothetical protein n=1 Tax=Clostridium tetanomorphum TaxID=1553 RepID=UPI001570866C|nr:hypothetical protein [Clostridium tetanomorphum]